MIPFEGCLALRAAGPGACGAPALRVRVVWVVVITWRGLCVIGVAPEDPDPCDCHCVKPVDVLACVLGFVSHVGV